MSNKFTISVDDQNKLIRYKHYGSIGYNDIGEAWEKFLEMKEFTELKYNLLSDYSDASFDMSTDTVHKIIDYLYNIKHILKGKKQSLIVTDPVSTAGAIYFEARVYFKTGFHVKVFSTEEAALRWLLR